MGNHFFIPIDKYATSMGTLPALPLRRVYMGYAGDMSEEPETHMVSNEKGCVAGYFHQNLQTVTFYDFFDPEQGISPAEVRAWRADRSLDPTELFRLFNTWQKERPPHSRSGISSDEVRGIPVGQIHRSVIGSLRKDSIAAAVALPVPTEEEIEQIIESGLIPTQWRNSRDFRAHARELRGLVAYLRAVYVDESQQPMRAVAQATGLDVAGSRKLIDQARNHQYLTRAGRSMGGFMLPQAYEASGLMTAAAKEAAKRK